MDIQKRILIGAGAVLGLIIAIVLLVMWSSREKVDPGTSPGTVATTTDPAITPGGNTTVPDEVPVTPSVTKPTENPSERQVRQFATMFVERYGSFSNQNNNSHIEDVQGMITPSFATWLATQKVPYAENYAGVTTKVMVASTVSYAADSATVSVQVQEVRQNKESSETVQRTGRVELVTVNGAWKINALYWDN